MKRIILYISVAVMAFLIGFGSDLALKKYRELTSPKIEGINYANVFTVVSATPASHYGEFIEPGSLPAELKRIDEHYQRLCHLPTDYSGEWTTIKQITVFHRCNEAWAKDRKDAIKAELANYLVRY